MALASVISAPLRCSSSQLHRCRTYRPAVIDLRFKGDAWVVSRDTDAAVCLGDFSLTQVTACSVDLPTLNRVFSQIRMSQARRNYLRRIERIP